MKKKSTTRNHSVSAFVNPRVLIGLFVFLTGVFLALASFGAFSSVFAQTNRTSPNQQAVRPASDAPEINLLAMAPSSIEPSALDQQESAAETETRVHITDPSLLKSLNYEPDATNVYAAPEAYTEMLMSPAERAAVSALESQEADVPDAEASSAFGETTGVSTIHASDFASVANDAVFSRPLFGVYLSCSSGNANFRGVFQDVPHGARLTVRRIWYYDDAPTQDITVWLEKICIPFFSAGDAEVTVLRMNSSSGTPGFGRFGPGNLIEETADTQSCVYTLRARLSNNNVCQQGGNPNILRLYKASLSWRRQVSPPPATATFSDVPTSSPLFPYVEALVGSEITAGCAPNLYCPGNPVTRGQMAVFLSRALGLNWAGPLTP
jgi:hypothetical protein